MRQLVLTGGDVLSAPEVSALESSGRELRSRVDHAQERTSKLLRRLESARDELGKLRFVFYWFQLFFFVHLINTKFPTEIQIGIGNIFDLVANSPANP